MSHPACDTQAGIAKAIRTLTGFNKLIEDRRSTMERYRGEFWKHPRQLLREWYILGRYVLDSCGDVSRVKIKRGRLPTHPRGARYLKDLLPRLSDDVLTHKEFITVIRGQWGNNVWVIHDQSARVPSSSAGCCTCGRPFTIRTCHDVVELRTDEVMSLDKFIGKRRKDILLLLDMNGAERRLLWNYAIRRKGSSEYWNIIDNGAEDDRVIKNGDEARYLVSRFYHARHAPRSRKT